MLAPSRLRRLLISFALAAGFLALYLSDLASVPFHPDESTQIFMSRDFDLLTLERDAAAFAWAPDQPLTLETRYRLLDAPLTRYLVGAGRWLRGLPAGAVNADWVWGATWEANQPAIPQPDVLLAGRLPLAVLGALAPAVIFWIGSAAGGTGAGLAAALLLGLNPLPLLHSRRAMAEGSLIFFTLVAGLGSVWLARACDAAQGLSWKWLGQSLGAGMLAGLAMASKQTQLIMLPAALMAAGLAISQRPWAWPERVRALAAVGAAVVAAAGLTFWGLNPILYRQPLPTAQAMLALRAQLAQEQIAVNGAANPDILTPSPASRLRAAFVQVYASQPAFWDAPVYLENLAPPAAAYLAQPRHRLFPQPWTGYLLAALTAVGLAVSVRRLARDRLGPSTRAEQVVWLWMAVNLALIALVIPLNWQRYFLPLLPLANIFSALGLVALLGWLATAFARAGLAPAAIFREPQP